MQNIQRPVFNADFFKLEIGNKNSVTSNLIITNNYKNSVFPQSQNGMSSLM